MRGITSPQVYRKYDFTEKVQIHPQSIIDGIPDRTINQKESRE